MSSSCPCQPCQSRAAHAGRGDPQDDAVVGTGGRGDLPHGREDAERGDHHGTHAPSSPTPSERAVRPARPRRGCPPPASPAGARSAGRRRARRGRRVRRPTRSSPRSSTEDSRATRRSSACSGCHGSRPSRDRRHRGVDGDPRVERRDRCVGAEREPDARAVQATRTRTRGRCDRPSAGRRRPGRPSRARAARWRPRPARRTASTSSQDDQLRVLDRPRGTGRGEGVEGQRVRGVADRVDRAAQTVPGGVRHERRPAGRAATARTPRRGRSARVRVVAVGGAGVERAVGDDLERPLRRRGRPSGVPGVQVLAHDAVEELLPHARPHAQPRRAARQHDDARRRGCRRSRGRPRRRPRVRRRRPWRRRTSASATSSGTWSTAPCSGSHSDSRSSPVGCACRRRGTADRRSRPTRSAGHRRRGPRAGRRRPRRAARPSARPARARRGTRSRRARFPGAGGRAAATSVTACAADVAPETSSRRRASAHWVRCTCASHRPGMSHRPSSVDRRTSCGSAADRGDPTVAQRGRRQVGDGRAGGRARSRRSEVVGTVACEHRRAGIRPDVPRPAGAAPGTGADRARAAVDALHRAARPGAPAGGGDGREHRRCAAGGPASAATTGTSTPASLPTSRPVRSCTRATTWTAGTWCVVATRCGVTWWWPGRPTSRRSPTRTPPRRRPRSTRASCSGSASRTTCSSTRGPTGTGSRSSRPGARRRRPGLPRRRAFPGSSGRSPPGRPARARCVPPRSCWTSPRCRRTLQADECPPLGPFRTFQVPVVGRRGAHRAWTSVRWSTPTCSPRSEPWRPQRWCR